MAFLVEFELGTGKDAMPDVFSARMPIYLVSSGNEKPTFEIPTHESLKILSDYNTPLKGTQSLIQYAKLIGVY